MKRRFAETLGLLVFLLALPTATAWAQVPAVRAQVVAVVGAGKAAQFRVPQVRLPDEGAAGRINGRIAQVVAGYAEQPLDSTAALPRQLRQAAALACCLSGSRYQVLLNQSALLSLKLTLEFHGAYYYERTIHLNFDLRTGRQLALADLLADPPAQLQRRLEAAINRRIGEFLADSSTHDRATRADLAERFHWDAQARRVRFGPAGKAATATPPSLGEFALTSHAVLLFYRVGLPATMLLNTPDEVYRFPYAKLRPTGLLVELNERLEAGGK